MSDSGPLIYECKVCGKLTVHKAGGTYFVDHGRGCKQVSSDGGGVQFVEWEDCYRDEPTRDLYGRGTLT